MRARVEKTWRDALASVTALLSVTGGLGLSALGVVTTVADNAVTDAHNESVLSAESAFALRGELSEEEYVTLAPVRHLGSEVSKVVSDLDPETTVEDGIAQWRAEGHGDGLTVEYDYVGLPECDGTRAPVDARVGNMKVIASPCGIPCVKVEVYEGSELLGTRVTKDACHMA